MIVWQVKNAKLKQEVDKINWVGQSTDINQSFILGYFSFLNNPVNPDIAKNNVHILSDKLKMMFGLIQDRALRRENVADLLAYIRIKTVENKKEDFGYAMAMFDDLINELVLDNDYIRTAYLKPKENSDIKVVPNRLEVLNRASSGLGI